MYVGCGMGRLGAVGLVASDSTCAHAALNVAESTSATFAAGHVPHEGAPRHHSTGSPSRSVKADIGFRVWTDIGSVPSLDEDQEHADPTVEPPKSGEGESV